MIQEIRDSYHRFLQHCWFEPESVDDLAQRMFDRLHQEELSAEQLDDPRSYLATNLLEASQALTKEGLDGLYYDTIRQFVFSLPHEQAVTLILHVDDGLTYTQIADRLGIDRQEALWYLTQGYTALRMRFRSPDTVHDQEK